MTDLNAMFDLIDDSLEAGNLTREDLNAIGEFAWKRAKDLRKAEGRKVAARLSKGTAVRIKMDAPLRPRYILGTEATVQKVNQTSATITLGEVHGGSGRFYTGQLINCPLDALELREGETP